MCGGPPRQSRGTSSQITPSVSQGIMTEDHDINNICTMTEEEEKDEFEVVVVNPILEVSHDYFEEQPEEPKRIIETEKVQKLIKVHYIEEEYVPENKRL
jgi:hypothetical protein